MGGSGPLDLPGPVCLLAGSCPATNAVFHALTAAFGDVPVVMEAPVPRVTLLRRRARKLGVVTVAGQVLFGALVVPVLSQRGKGRIAAIAAEHGLDLSAVDGPIERVPSVNSEEARQALGRLEPSVVVVSGTRIIGPATLGCVPAPFVNLHAGITPQYRGVHGGYWALAEGRPELFGSTVHLVDAGIDTGRVLAHVTVSVTADDSFVTYPYLQLAAGLPLLVDAVARLRSGDELPAGPLLSPDGPSRLRSHPTLWGYLTTRLKAF